MKRGIVDSRTRVNGKKPHAAQRRLAFEALEPRQLLTVVPSGIGDFVWHDLNANGIQETGEPGINGAAVSLWEQDGASFVQLAQTTTDFDEFDRPGYYSFGDAPMGSNLQVRFELPEGYDKFSPFQADGSPDSNLNSDAPTSHLVILDVEYDENDEPIPNLTLDAGVYQYAALGDYVWLDADRDGVQDTNENGLEGVTVKLLQDNVEIASTTTDSAGKYLFDQLTPGVYQVQFVAPAGYTFTGRDQGSDDAVDSDVGADGLTVAITLHSGQNDVTWDAGLQQPPPPPTVSINVEKYVKVGCAGEGLTPGYWKQCQHFDDWVGYGRCDNYNAVFGLVGPAAESSSLTLLGALGRGGGGAAALGRQAVAAMLNAAHSQIDYLYSTAEIIALVRQAYATGQFESAKNLLAAQNELGASFCNPCATPGPGQDADTPGDALVVSRDQRVTFTYLVTNTGDMPLAEVVLTDSQDGIHPVYRGGDTNGNGLLDTSEEWKYTASFTATCSTSAGMHVNLATATGKPRGDDGTLGDAVTDIDPAYWQIGTSTGCNTIYNSSLAEMAAELETLLNAGATSSLDQFFNELGKSSISGRVWNDADGDGVFDQGEAALAGVKIRLTGCDMLGGRVDREATTDANGQYSFIDLLASDAAGYTLTEQQPAGYADGKDSVGTLNGRPDGTLAANDVISRIMLGWNDDAINYNFAEKTAKPTSCTSWHDLASWWWRCGYSRC